MAQGKSLLTMHVIALLGLLAVLPWARALFGEKGSPVLRLTEKNFANLVDKSHHTFVIKYFADWCGHCRNFAPQYAVAAKKLSGMIKFGAVNCDTEKELCAKAGVKGFPTIKIHYTNLKKNKRHIKDYERERTAKALGEFAKGNVPNAVARIGSGKGESTIEAFLKKHNDTLPKLLIVKPSSTPTNPKLKFVALEYYKKIAIAEKIDKVLSKPTIRILRPLPAGDTEELNFPIDSSGVDFNQLIKFLKPLVSKAETAKTTTATTNSKKDKGEKDSAKKANAKETPKPKKDKEKTTKSKKVKPSNPDGRIEL